MSEIPVTEIDGEFYELIGGVDAPNWKTIAMKYRLELERLRADNEALKADRDDWKAHVTKVDDWRRQAELDRDLLEAANACLLADNEALRTALHESLEQNEGCFANHYGDNPEGAAIPKHIQRARRLLAQRVSD